jgi:hypothetical protein
MPGIPAALTDAQWSEWLSRLPQAPGDSGQVDTFHRDAIDWLLSAPPVGTLGRNDANLLALSLLSYLGQLNQAQGQGVGQGDVAIGVAVVGLIGAALGGPVGGIGGALVGLGAALYVRKQEADHRRRQNMIREVERLILELLGRL